jgi:hypothetical protein
MPKGFNGGAKGRLLPKPPICPLKLCMCPTFLVVLGFNLIYNLVQNFIWGSTTNYTYVKMKCSSRRFLANLGSVDIIGPKFQAKALLAKFLVRVRV